MAHLINFSLSRWKLEEDWRYLNNQDEEGPWLGHSWQSQRLLIYFVKGSITVRLTSCLTGLDSIKQSDMFRIRHKQSSYIQTKNMRSAIQLYFPLQSMRVFSGCFWHQGDTGSNPVNRNL